MGHIIALDQNMVNMIAAGEVIERPASVVKELMENSIDAGATRITVSVEDGGRRLISVSDDGCGMDGEDLARAFQPHTTSKIRTSSDLRGISTLGFRGEALASRIRSCTQANSIEIDCGDQGVVAPCSGDYGTTIQIRDIFYKLPARRKFLRTTNTEMGHITEQFTRIALGCCRMKGTALEEKQPARGPLGGDLDLTLIHNGRELCRLSGGQNIQQRVSELFPMLSTGRGDDFLKAESDERGLRIFALLGKPTISRTSNRFQYVFLNGRFVRDKFISHAIREAYRGLLEPNRLPVIFLFIRMPYEDYDVNVHPTKIEVRFFNANLVHSQVLGCLRENLLAADLEVQAKLPLTAGRSEGSSIPAAGRRNPRIAEAMAEFLRKHRPAHTQQRFETSAGARPVLHGPASAQATGARTGPEAQGISLGQRRFLQLHDSFIVAQTDDGFIIIDQHALHERIMYEHLRKRIQKGTLESQRLLMPESFEVNARQADLLATNNELVEKLGIEIVPFGPNTMAVQAFPTLLGKADPLEFVRDLTDLLERRDATVDAERLLDDVLNMAACKAAIKAGQRLSDSEIEHLLADREVTEYASRCPHGRPTTIRFSISDLEKQFKRT
jgi:DNA mismatch repair protein MutL